MTDMKFFVIIILGCYILSLLNGEKSSMLSKDKVEPLRGILSIIIILHHLYIFEHIHFLSQFRSWGALVVSIFFFISGYGLCTSYKINGDNYLKGFFKRRVWGNVAIPFLIIVLVQQILQCIYSVYLNQGMLIKSIGERWFIVVIILLYALFYVSARFVDIKKIGISITCGVILYIFICFLLEADRCWFISVAAFPTGVLYSENEKKIISWLNSGLLKKYSLVPTLLILTILFYYLGLQISPFIFIGVYILLPLVFALLCSSLKVELFNKSYLLRSLSQISYELYLTHGVVILWLKKIELTQNAVILVSLVLSLSVILAFLVKIISVKIRKAII